MSCWPAPWDGGSAPGGRVVPWLQMVEEGHFSWGLKTLKSCKICSSHWEGHCPVPWVFIFCPEIQPNPDSTVGAVSCFLCCLSKVSGCTLCQEQGQTCVTSLLTETSSALGPAGSAGAVLSPQGVGDRTATLLWCGVGVLPLSPQYPSPVLTQEVLRARPADLQAVQAAQPSSTFSGNILTQCEIVQNTQRGADTFFLPDCVHV